MRCDRILSAPLTRSVIRDVTRRESVLFDLTPLDLRAAYRLLVTAHRL